MERKNYFWLLLLVILYFVGLTFQLPGEDTNLFVRELYFAFFLLIVASIGLYSIASMIRAAWMYFIVFFAITVFNTLYLYIAANAGESLTTAMIVLGLVGIVYSTKQLGKKQCMHKKREEPEEKVGPIIVDDIEPEETEVSTKKAATKKTASKKTAKKSTKSKAKKATTKSTAKKSTKKSTAKKSTKKAATKSAAKKSTANKKTTGKKASAKSTKKSTAKKATKKATSKKSTAKKSTKKTTKKR